MAEENVTGIDLVVVSRLAKLLLMTTQDARRELDAYAPHDQLRREVEVAAAVAQELAKVLGLADFNALRERRAMAMARAAISKAQSAQ
jgi:hypothetical protein